MVVGANVQPDVEGRSKAKHLQMRHVAVSFFEGLRQFFKPLGEKAPGVWGPVQQEVLQQLINDVRHFELAKVVHFIVCHLCAVVGYRTLQRCRDLAKGSGRCNRLVHFFVHSQPFHPIAVTNSQNP